PTLAFSTDHSLCTAMVDTGSIIRNHRSTRTATWNNSRIIYEYDKATNENWNNYAAQVKAKIYNNPNLDSILLSDSLTQEGMDYIWDILMDAIQAAATNNIPTKNIANKDPRAFHKAPNADIHSRTLIAASFRKIIKKVIEFDLSLDYSSR